MDFWTLEDSGEKEVMVYTEMICLWLGQVGWAQHTCEADADATERSVTESADRGQLS